MNILISGTGVIGSTVGMVVGRIAILCALALAGCDGAKPGGKGNIVPMEKAIVIDAPIRAVCVTPNTPGSKVPSHGTDKYGEAYAIDFVVIDEGGKSKKAYRKSALEYVVKGLDLSEFYGWSVPVYAPMSGTVIKVVNGISERNLVRVLSDIRNTMKVTRAYEAGVGTQESITGNCVMLDCGDGVYALLAHLKKGSVVVEVGQAVRSGQAIGRLGHSGNSTMPHLHLQFMDSPDFRVARGIPFAIRAFHVRTDGEWVAVEHGLPTDSDIVRFD